MKETVFEKELQKIEKKEIRIMQAMEKKTPPAWRTKIEEKIPAKALSGLQSAFQKAFGVIFEKGTGVLEKTYNKDSIEKEFMVRDFAVNLQENRKSMRLLKNHVSSSNLKNMAITSVEGIGLGALGVGLPDIVLFIGMILRGTYEIALKYGFDYERPEERMLILQMLETVMLSGQEWKVSNKSIDHYIESQAHIIPEESDIQEQILRTSEAFATDMLVVKFIQGLPIVGIIGGMGNPIYYKKIMEYVELKYRKRYVVGKILESYKKR